MAAAPISSPAPRRRDVVAAILRGQRGFARWIVALLVVYLAIQGLFVLATVTAAAVPNDAIVASLQRDADLRLWDTTDYPLDGVGHPTERFPFAGITDSFTECISLTIGVPADPDGASGIVRDSIAGRHLGTCSMALPAIAALAAGDEPEQVFTYNRYWNGFTILTRPLLALEGVATVRLAVGLIFVGGIVTAAIALTRRVSPWAAAGLLVPLLASTNLVTQPLHGFSHALSFGIMMFAVAWGVRLGRETLPAIIIGASVAGAVFNFVDFLLNPPVAWALFVFAVVSARWQSRRHDRMPLRELWGATGAGALGWIAGYGLTWVTRWAIAVATFGESAWQEILGVISTRLQGQYQDLVTPGLGQSTVRNALFWLGTIPTSRFVLLLAVLTILVCLAVILLSRRPGLLLVALAIGSPILLVVLWLELLSNHSQIHVFFVYRAIPAAIGIAVATALVVLAKARPLRASAVTVAEPISPVAQVAPAERTEA